MTDSIEGVDEVLESLGLTPTPEEKKELVAQAKYENVKAALNAKYQAEKLVGIRQPNGVMPLKKLNNKHKLYIAMHLQGVSYKDIALQTGATYQTVYRCINDPLARAVIEEFRKGFEDDLKALFPLAIDAVRKGLTSKDTELALKAVDRFKKLSQDDVAPSGTNVTVTVIQEAREKFVGELRDLAAEAKLIEATVE